MIGMEAVRELALGAAFTIIAVNILWWGVWREQWRVGTRERAELKAQS